MPRAERALVAAGPVPQPLAPDLDVLTRLRARRVLLVEDNEFNQRVASELLRDVAGNGA